MGVSVATGAGMLRRVGMDAPLQVLRLVGVAAFALHLCHLGRMRIFLDRGVAVVAFKAAVDAVAEGFAVDRDAVACGILHLGSPWQARQSAWAWSLAGSPASNSTATAAARIPL